MKRALIYTVTILVSAVLIFALSKGPPMDDGRSVARAAPPPSGAAATNMAAPGAIGGTTPNTGAFTTLTAAPTDLLYVDGSANTGTNSTVSHVYIATPFTPANTVNISQIIVRAKLDGTLGSADYLFQESVKIYSDSAGSPGSSLSSGSGFEFGGLTTSYASVPRFIKTSSPYYYTLTGGTKYWLVEYRIVQPTTANVVMDSALCSTAKYSDDGSTWNPSTYCPYYLIYGLAGTALTSTARGYTGTSGILGLNTPDVPTTTINGGAGVSGRSWKSVGVIGESYEEAAVKGYSTFSDGVNGQSKYGTGTVSSSQYAGGATVSQTGSVANSSNASATLNVAKLSSGSAGSATGDVIYAVDNATATTLGGALFNGIIGSTTRTRLDPRNNTNPAYLMDTSVALTTGTLLSIKNNNTEKFSVDYAGAVTAGSVTIGTAGPAQGMGENPQTVSANAVTCNWALGSTCGVAMQNAATAWTLTMSNPVAGAVYHIDLIQNATGGASAAPLPTFSPTIRSWQGGQTPTPTTTANKVDHITCKYSAVTGEAGYDCAISQNY